MKGKVLKFEFRRPPDRLGKALEQIWRDWLVEEGAKEYLRKRQIRRKKGTTSVSTKNPI